MMMNKNNSIWDLTMKVNDRVKTKYGAGVITWVDNTTYSITTQMSKLGVVYEVRLTDGKYAGETIVQVESESEVDNV